MNTATQILIGLCGKHLSEHSCRSGTNLRNDSATRKTTYFWVVKHKLFFLYDCIETRFALQRLIFKKNVCFRPFCTFNHEFLSKFEEFTASIEARSTRPVQISQATELDVGLSCVLFDFTSRVSNTILMPLAATLPAGQVCKVCDRLVVLSPTSRAKMDSAH